MLDSFTVGNTTFSSRLLVGTGKYASYNLMHDSLVASQYLIVMLLMNHASNYRMHISLSPLTSD